MAHGFREFMYKHTGGVRVCLSSALAKRGMIACHQFWSYEELSYCGFSPASTALP